MLRNEWAHIPNARQALDEGQDADKLPVSHVVVPGHNGHAVVDLVAEHLKAKRNYSELKARGRKAAQAPKKVRS